MVKVSDDIGGIGEVVSWEPLIVRVWPTLELYQVCRWQYLYLESTIDSTLYSLLPLMRIGLGHGLSGHSGMGSGQ